MTRRLRRLLSTKEGQFYEKYTVGRTSIRRATGWNGDSRYGCNVPKPDPKQKIVAIAQGVGKLEMWASVRRAAPKQAPYSAVVAALLSAL